MPIIRYLLIVLLIGIFYYLSAIAGMGLSFPPDRIAVFWPPNTIFLSALILLPPRRWWLCFLSVIPAYFIAAYQFEHPTPRAIVFFVANCTEVFTAAFLLRHFLRSSPQFVKLKEVGVYILSAVVIAPLVSASIASVATFWEQDIAYWLTFRVWYLGDAIAHLTFTPLVLVWTVPLKDFFKTISLQRIAEAFVLSTVLLATCLVAFTGETGTPSNLSVLLYLPLPVLLWTSVRFGPRGIYSAIFIMTLISIWNAVNGRGPFIAINPVENVFSLQIFIIVVSIPLIFLMVLIQEKNQAETLLKESEERKRLAVLSGKVGLWGIDLNTDTVWWDEAYDMLWGGRPKSSQDSWQWWIDRIHPADRDQVKKSLEDTIRGTGDQWTNEYRLQISKGDYAYIVDRAMIERDKTGAAKRVLGAMTDITDLLKARRAEAEREERHRAILSTAMDGFWITDTAGRFLEVNETYCEMSGYSKDELLGMDISAVEDIETAAVTAAHMQNVMAGGQGRFESRHRRKDGSVFNVEVSVQYRTTDEPTCVVFIRDITERKRDERALQQTLDGQNLNIALLDDHGKIIFVNKNWRRFAVANNCSAEIVSDGVNYLDVCDRAADDGDPIATLFADNFRKLVSGVFPSFEFDYSCHSPQKERYFNCAVTQITGHDMLGAVVSHQDITTRKQAEMALRESEEKHRTLFETMVQGVLYQSADGSIISANKTAERILGLTFDQMQERTSVDPRWKSIHEDGSDFPGDTHPTMMALKTGKVVSNVVMGIFNPKIGAHTWVNINAVPQFKPGENKPYQAYVTFEDITERKKEEEELLLNKSRFESLLKLNDMSETSDKAIADFILEQSVSMTKSTIGFLGFMSEDESEMLIHAWSRFTMAECAVTDKPIHYPIEKAGLWGEAVRQKKTTVVNDYDEPNPSKVGLPEGHVQLKRLISIPVIDNNRVVAVLAVGNKEELYDDGDVRHLTLLTEGMWRIMQRRRAENALKQQKYYLEKAQELGQIGTWELDLKRNRLVWTEENCRIFGVPPGSVVNYEIFLDKVHPEDREYVHQEWSAALEGKPYDIDHRLVVDGKIKWVREKADLFLDKDGKPYRAVGVTQDITIRKQAEQARLESEKRHLAFFENTLQYVWHYEFKPPVPVDLPVDKQVECILDQAELVDCNKTFAELHGFASVDEIVGIKMRQTQGEALEGIKKLLRAFIKNGYRFDNTEGLEHLVSGEFRYFLNLGSGVVKNECLVEVFGSSIDITERKKTEEDLLEKQNRLDLALEAAKAGTWVWNVRTEEVFWDDRMQEIFGLEPGTFAGTYEGWKERVHPEDINDASEATISALQGKSKYDAEYRVKAKDENWRTVNAQAVVVSDKNSDPEYMAGIVVDVTDRKNAEKERMQLSTAIEQAHEIIFITNPEGIIEYVNPAFSEVTGYSSEEAVGKKTSILKSGKQDTLFYKRLWETISSGRVWQGYFINKKKDGSLYDEEATISPVKNNEGDITHFVAIKSDVTKQIKTEEQLRQAQKMEAIGTLAGGIAHDFNNILSALIGYTELALEDVADRPETFDSLQQVLVSAGRAKDLVKQILAVSRSTKAEKKPVKTKLIVKEVCQFLRSTLPANVEIRQNLSAEKDIILADATQFHQVLMNLCTNAGHSMEDNGGVLEVRLENIFLKEGELFSINNLEAGPYLKLTVKDQGSGIKKEELGRIFEPYYSSKGKGEGTGLGLAVVHGIVREHKGDIKVESELGSGSAFTVLFPLVKEIIAEKTLPDTKNIPAGTETILFVDDEETLLNVAKITLNRLGYKVITALNGEDAIETFNFAREAYDLVITDRTMPGMSGYKLVQELRKVRSDIPVIMCSGFDESKDKKNIDKYNINAFISKPLDKKILALTVRRVLNEKNN